MSDKKQVIHVKDLIIKADRVVIEQKRPHKREHDPFFSRPASRLPEEDEKKDKSDDQKDEHDHKGKDEGRPFSWF